MLDPVLVAISAVRRVRVGSTLTYYRYHILAPPKRLEYSSSTVNGFFLAGSLR
jgi:hypothetical protein